MEIYGIDFTSRPKRNKSATCLEFGHPDDMDPLEGWIADPAV